MVTVVVVEVKVVVVREAEQKQQTESHLTMTITCDKASHTLVHSCPHFLISLKSSHTSCHSLNLTLKSTVRSSPLICV